jgi:5'-methylthioadenosine phosphorylase
MEQGLTGLIGGSGLGDVLADKIKDAKFCNVATPFGKPSGRIMVGRIGKRRVAFINRHGRGHKLSPSEVPYAANIFALKKLGAHSVIATCAVGSLRGPIRPAELVIVDQFIDRTFRRKNTFFDGYGAVHAEMAQPTCNRLGNIIAEAAKKLDVRTHRKGTYVGIEGPMFSTRAESLMHRIWGGDLIGMTAMPEVKLAREAQMCYSLVALVSDYDCWKPQKKKRDKQELLREIIGNLKRASGNCLKLIEAILSNKHELVCDDCDCRRSLDMAVWTEKKFITAAQKRKVAVLFE